MEQAFKKMSPSKIELYKGYVAACSLLKVPPLEFEQWEKAHMRANEIDPTPAGAGQGEMLTNYPTSDGRKWNELDRDEQWEEFKRLKIGNTLGQKELDTLRAENAKLRAALKPMAAIGKFYKLIIREYNPHDVVLYEGTPEYTIRIDDCLKAYELLNID